MAKNEKKEQSPRSDAEQNAIVDDVPKHGDPLGADQTLYRTVIDSLTDYAVFAVSPSGSVISWNAGAEKTFGYTKEEILGKNFSIIFTAEDVKNKEPENELATALSGDQTQHDRWHVRQDGSRFWGTNTVHPLYDEADSANRKLVGFTKLVRDTTNSHIAMEELSDSEQQLRMLVESVRDYAIFSITLDGTVKTWNAGAQKIFGYEQNEIIGRNFSELYGPEDIARDIPQTELREATADGTASMERWLVRKDQTRFLASSKLSQLKRDPAGDLRGFVKIAHDITTNHIASQDLRHRAQYDELTGLANRRTFYDYVYRAIASIKRRPENLFAILFVDLDHFKRVNDEFGHTIADQLLNTTARRLERSVRTEDVVARIGGDEFSILLNGISGIKDATEAAARIGTEMSAPMKADKKNVYATVSIGIALGMQEYNLPEDILRDADIAMYNAKASGRARAAVFDPSLTGADRTHSNIAADLSGALERGEFRVLYQPIIRLKTKQVVGFEALLRWEHPKRGMLKPIDFIALAETTDLILTIDRWVLRSACSQLYDWRIHGMDENLKISVNISSKAFSRGNFLEDLEAILESTKLPAKTLRLEITESLILERSERIDLMLTEIRKLGVEIDFDDFGTGFSSLDSLQHITVDSLKIDQSFVAGIDSIAGASLVETVIFLAHKLGITTVAEGVETPIQLLSLQKLGCDLGQGYLFSQPLEPIDASRFSLVGGAVA